MQQQLWPYHVGYYFNSLSQSKTSTPIPSPIDRDDYCPFHHIITIITICDGCHLIGNKEAKSIFMRTVSTSIPQYHAAQPLATSKIMRSMVAYLNSALSWFWIFAEPVLIIVKLLQRHLFEIPKVTLTVVSMGGEIGGHVPPHPTPQYFWWALLKSLNNYRWLCAFSSVPPTLTRNRRRWLWASEALLFQFVFKNNIIKLSSGFILFTAKWGWFMKHSEKLFHLI